MYNQTQVTSETGFLSKEIKELLELQDITIEDETDLSKSQKKAFKVFKKGGNVLIIGQAGVGKSKSIKVFEEYSMKNFPEKKFYITASTGISAYNIGGVTIHSFLGIGTGNGDKERILRRVMNKKDIVKRIRETDIIVLDEASMISAEIFELIDYLLKKVRKNNGAFGGIQFILSMDPLQLLPVFKSINGEKLDERLIVESEVFKSIFKKKNVIMLLENFRQMNNPEFIDILSRIRLGIYTKEDIEKIKGRMMKKMNTKELKGSEGAISIVTSNRKAQIINNKNYDKLEGDEMEYGSKIMSSGKSRETCEILEKELEKQFDIKGLKKLKLRSGARVMLVKNLNTGIGLVNGAIGTVMEFVDGIPKVKFDNGVEEMIDFMDWTIEIDENKGIGIQLPLILAYALTSHKVQGLTLDKVICDLSDCFCEAQVYVVLSRARNINSLYLKTFDEKKIRVNKVMLDFLALNFKE